MQENCQNDTFIYSSDAFLFVMYSPAFKFQVYVYDASKFQGEDRICHISLVKNMWQIVSCNSKGKYNWDYKFCIDVKDLGLLLLLFIPL